MLRVILLALCSFGAVAQTPPPVETFFRHPNIISAALSPSGKRLAVSATHERAGRVGLAVLDLESPAPTYLRTALFRDADVDDFEWVDDERLIFGVIDLKSGSGEDYTTARGLYSTRFDGSSQITLVEREDAQRAGLHLNHVLLHVPVPGEGREGERAQEVIVGELLGVGREVRRIVPKWVNVSTGLVRRFDDFGAPNHARHWWFTPQGQPRLVMTRRGDHVAYHWLTTSSSGARVWKSIAEGTVLDTPMRPAWVGDDRLLVTREVGPALESALFEFDFAKGGPSEQALVRVPGFDFKGHYLNSPDGRLLGVRVQADAEQTVWFDAQHRSLQEMVDARFPGQVNQLTCRRCGAADAVVLVRTSSDRQPGQLWLHTRADGKWRLVGRVRADIDAQQMVGTDLVRIKARDGRDLPVWITGQRKDAQGRPLALATVVLVHGGPWARIGYWEWEPMRQFLASRGYLVVEPEFRGTTGYGRTHFEAGFKQWGQAMQDDVADALLWARAQGWASDKACIAGSSYGGYSALMGLIRHPDLYRCGAAWMAVTDLLLHLEGSMFVSDDINAWSRRYGYKAMVGDPTTEMAMLKAHSPVEQAHRIRAPLLLAYGEEDLRVPLAHGKRLRSALQAAGRPAPEWVLYPDEGHEWRKQETQFDFARRLERFLAQHLK